MIKRHESQHAFRRFPVDAHEVCGQRDADGSHWICQAVNSLDDFIRGREQRERDCEAERLRGPEIDYHLEFFGLHNR